MKKKNTFLAVALLLAVVVLGVGYAAASGPWVVNGTATASAETDFDVSFTAVDDETASFTETEGTMSVTLANVGDSETVTFTLTNSSPKGIKAVIDPSSVVVTYEDEQGEVTAESSEYFLVEPTLSANEISSDGGEVTLAVKVTLKKAALTEVTEDFKVSIGTIEAGQE